MKKEISSQRVKYCVALILWGILFSILLKPLVKGNQDAINLVVNVFAILAGFLIAIITFIGDPKSLPPGSWRVAELSTDRVNSRLLRHKILFQIYLVVLVLIFMSILFKKSAHWVQEVIEYLYLFFASVSIIISFSLPSKLMELQKERIDYEIKERKKAEDEKNSQS